MNVEKSQIHAQYGGRFIRPAMNFIQNTEKPIFLQCLNFFLFIDRTDPTDCKPFVCTVQINKTTTFEYIYIYTYI